MTNRQESGFARRGRPEGSVHDCKDAGGRATQGAVAEGGTL